MSEHAPYTVENVLWSVSDGNSLTTEVQIPTIAGARARAVLEGRSTEQVSVGI
jgi:hypothetical protein